MTGSEEIVFLGEKGIPDKRLLELVGGKSANLMRAWRKKGFSIPPGFTITTHAFLGHYKRAKITPGMGPGQVRGRLVDTQLDGVLKKDIIHAIGRLGRGKDMGVVVRSSASAEDLEDASFAGQQESYLDIRDWDELFLSIKMCWASAYEDRALFYREKKAGSKGLATVAVLVQTKVEPVHSGVAFSKDPLGSGCIVVEAIEGMGEGLVSGETQPSRFHVKRDIKSIVHRVEKQGVKVGDEDVLDVARMCLSLERKRGFPADIEWASDENALWLLQARPITSLVPEQPIHYVEMRFRGISEKTRERIIRGELGKIKRERGQWTQKPLNERIVMPMCPWEQSILALTVEPIYETLGSLGLMADSSARKPFTVSFGKPYINVSFLSELFEGMPEAVDMILASGHTDQAKIKPRLSLKAITLGTKLLGMVGTVLKEWEERSAIFKTEIDRLEKVDIEKLDYKKSVKMLDGMLEHLKVITPIHFRSVILAEALFNVLVEFLHVMWFKDADERATRLIGGLKENVTVRTNVELMELAGDLRRSEALRVIALSGVLTSDGLSKRDRRFLKKFDRFLDEYGHRDPVHSLMFPTWKEEPETVMSILVSMSKADPASLSRQDSIRQRVSTEKETLNELKKWTGRILPLRASLFKQILRYTRAYMVLRENQQFVMGRTFPLIRKNLLHIGKQLSEKGLLDSPFEAFFLTQPELKKGVAALLKRGEIDVGYRIHQFGVFNELNAPVLYDTEDIAGIKKALFDRKAGKGRSFQGVGVSPGTYQGPAKVMLQAKDLHLFEPGEVLVCSTTNPAWTPVFPLAGAIVTDVGGMLSHGAVVAREYRVPAVLGTETGTIRIKTGDIVSVDGRKGKVKIVKRSSK